MKIRIEKLVYHIQRPRNMSKFARAMGVSRQTAYNWFTGKFKPTDYHLKLIAEYKDD